MYQTISENFKSLFLNAENSISFKTRFSLPLSFENKKTYLFYFALFFFFIGVTSCSTLGKFDKRNNYEDNVTLKLTTGYLDNEPNEGFNVTYYDIPYFQDINVFQALSLLELINSTFTFQYETFYFGHFITSVNSIEGKYIIGCEGGFIDCGADEIILKKGSVFNVFYDGPTNLFAFPKKRGSESSIASCPALCN
eukprot:TRINITY_DN2549_c0_g4_i1.p1 TRINITY_DN2549_c0_g4~~TRINITY_DN2549_c0_g4_i1.p1  ORF type:complete len:195 (-),score=45.54 TRINITY_DN2549_c0_g4_i1:91-675(-)